MIFWHGIPQGIEFRSGTTVNVKFASTPDLNAIRKAMDSVGLHNARIQPYGPAANNEELITLDLKEGSEQTGVDQGETLIIKALSGNVPEGKKDLNNATVQSIQDALVTQDPLHVGINVGGRYLVEAQNIIKYRDSVKGGVLGGFDDLKNATSPQVVSALQNN